MHAGMAEFLEEQTKGLAEMAENLRKTQLEAARKAAHRAAARVRSLNTRAREMARSGVRLSNISHGTLQRLIGLHEEVVTAALMDAASQLEKLAYTESARDLGRQQAAVLKAARERIVSDVARGMSILREAAAEVRKTAPVGRAPAAAKAKAGKRKAKRKAMRKVGPAARTAQRKARPVARKAKRRAATRARTAKGR